MERFIILLLLVPYLSGYTFVEENSCPCSQPFPLQPVCATDGKTYWSEECAKCMNPALVITRKWFCPRLDIELEG
ncbi:hypothetical protein O3G_MSEX006690 [Manduca sexta]|uniref:Kazal-like domain-containing protein n=1 Tax=Manduca sexta TaxID=7130 RepID=A0A922CLQ0_MANSE|nr:hypothetical protein O3G_MSEX006690 [Manduca sexta]